MKLTNYRAVASMLSLALIAALIVSVGLPSDAFAAVPHGAHAAIGSLGDVLSHYAPHMAAGVAAIRADIDGLTKRAADKLAEIKTGMDEEKVRKIEEEHAAILEQVRVKKDELAAEERREQEERLRNSTAHTQPALDEAAVRAAATAAAADATRAERERVNTIRTLARSAGVSETFSEQHERDGTTVDAFRSALLDHLVSAEGREVRSHTPVQMGQSDQEKRALAIENALMHRAAPADVELTNEGRNFRGMTLLEIGRDLLEARGVRTRGMSKNELAEAALTRMGGLHTTSDFPGILANVANKTLRRAYEAAPQTFRPLVRETSVPDFKAVTRNQLGEAPALNKVNEHGEFKRGTLGEGKESYKIATYGKIVGITRQVIVNDDLDAFSRLPAAFGVQAAQLESDLVWGQILSNPNMGDGVPLFHASHGNLAASGAAITVDTMSDARTAFAVQTGLDGKTVLGLMARYLIVPVKLQTKAEQFLGQIYAAKNSDLVPESLKRFQIITEARLDVGINRPEDDIVASGSQTAWYLAGDPATTDIVELAYLDGNRGVYTETRTGFDIDGVEVKVRLDVGAKVIDWRNIYKNAGA